jgi:lysophospholipase L1-like esterase
MQKIKNFLKKHKKELLLLLAVIILCFLFLEVFTRVYFFGYKALYPDEGSHLVHLHHSGFIQTAKNCEIMYELKPNLDTNYKLVGLKTNSQGLRDKEYQINKPNNTYRVVVLGDSFTMPEGVEIDSAYHSILENEFNQEDSSKKYEFINFGIGGYNLNKYLATLEYKGLEYQPDHVLVGMCLGNDIPFKDINPLREMHCNFQPEYLINTYIVPASLYVTYSKINEKRLMKERNKREFDVEKLDALIKEFKTLSEREDFEVTFVVLRRDKNEDQIQFDILKESVEKNSLNFIDTSAEFKEEGKKYWIYRFDTHPNAEANKIFARAIKKSIKLD